MFKSLKGVSKSISGYAGGKKENAQYKKICSGTTDHIDIVEVSYDNKIISTK